MAIFPFSCNTLMRGCLLLVSIAAILPLQAQITVTHGIQQIAHAGVLYTGSANQLLITGAGATDIQSSARSILVRNDKGITVRPVIREGTDTLRFYRGPELLLEKVFRVISPADPFTQLAFSPDTIQTVSRILNNPFVGVWYPDGKVRSEVHVVSFACTVYKSSGQVFHFTAKGNRLSAAMIPVIKSLRSGDRIELDQVRAVTGREENAKFLPPLKVVIR